MNELVFALAFFEAEIYLKSYGNNPPPKIAKARPDWLSVFDGGKTSNSK
ncbi:hypothetical protein [Methylocystis parvus]|nr:hypothetical protein [Methylocystis parvus]WBK00116.1 hypothetical protein MMG94_19450 [Methylocystis parvus OBBP]